MSSSFLSGRKTNWIKCLGEPRTIRTTHLKNTINLFSQKLKFTVVSFFVCIWCICHYFSIFVKLPQLWLGQILQVAWVKPDRWMTEIWDSLQSNGVQCMLGHSRCQFIRQCPLPWPHGRCPGPSTHTPLSCPAQHCLLGRPPLPPNSFLTLFMFKPHKCESTKKWREKKRTLSLNVHWNGH